MMRSLKAGDLVYLPANFRLRKHNRDGTISQYCELKEPSICIVVGCVSDITGDVDIFYRGQTWNASKDLLEPYVSGEKEKQNHASYTG